MLTATPLQRTAPARARAQAGATIIEVLISIMITAFGLLALAGLQTKMNSAVLESYQRSQALTLLRDMTQRIQANQNNGGSYVTASPVGADDTAPADCSTLGPSATRAQLDLCEWSNALKGAGEVQGSTNVGAMIGGRGCVEQLQPPNPAAGVCEPGIYRLTVVWQGLNATVAPSVTCAANLYGTDDSLRRAVVARVVTPLPACS